MTRCQECHKKIRSNTDTEIGPHGEVLCGSCYWKAMEDYWRKYEDEKAGNVRFDIDSE